MWLFLIKKEYEGASLLINNSINNSRLNYLIGFNNSIIKDKNILSEKLITKLLTNYFINMNENRIEKICTWKIQR